MFKPADLFDLRQTGHAALFDGCEFSWDALRKIAAYLAEKVPPGRRPRIEGGASVGDNVVLGEGTVVEEGALIQGPAIIGRNCQIRHNAYLRENVIVGDDCVVGNSTEIKNAILFNGAVAPHFNYVGDSILGCRAHLGAGVILSNFRSLPGNVMVELDGKPYDTGLRKFGALVGDGAEIGCNAVLNPGSIIGRGAVIYPCTSWRGILPANMIAKNRAAVEVIVRRPRTG
jgi:UDP-N-acetylglucosamine diphosphorylase / glucose-1-phosphate thymidylyltransferase / UDP-N-acetylgalactosamine diphosphorylase / glucosamine-1-phosphate N-acetyltransferase / galactosamine-1-phosphate N-acetyltransferase